jgi:uncharacterized protein (DUF885 family)
MERRPFIRHTAEVAASVGILRLLLACRPGGDAGSAASPTDRSVGDLRDRFFLRSLELYPTTATYLGGDGYTQSLAGINGKLRDPSPAAVSAEVEFYREIRGELAKLDRAALSPDRRVDHDLLGAQLEFMLHQLADRRYQERAIDTYVAEPFRGVDWQIQQMQDAGAGMLGTEAEWDLLLRRVEAVPGFLDGARAQLQAGIASGNVPDWRMVDRDGIKGSASNAEYFRTTLPATATPFLGDQAFAPRVRERLAEAGDIAARAWEEFAAWLGGSYDLAKQADHYALGEEEYAWRLENCLRVNRSVAELWDYGAQQVELYERRIFAAAERVATDARLGLPFGTDAEKRASVRKVMEHLGADSPKDDEELLAWYVDAGRRSVEYGRAQNLFDVPQDYRLDVFPTPPVLRSSIDAAYYPAPPFKTTGVGRFYLTPTNNDPGALKLNNRASVATTAIHEGFPGHDWHYKYMTQHAKEIPNIRWYTPGGVEDSSSMWSDSMATEGWALYSEELMAEAAPGKPDGFYTPAELMYMLQGQLMRAVRVRVDTGLHSGRMTFDEAIDYFAEHVEFMPGARQQASRDPAAKAVFDGAGRAIYRYSKWPTQAITYNLGKNEIAGLRAALKDKEGASFDLKRFHERFMSQGTLPSGYIRDVLLADHQQQ